LSSGGGGGWTGARGHDITRDALEWRRRPGGNDDDDDDQYRPKINITGYGESGFNVKNMVKKLDAQHEHDTDGTVHMNGSIIAFPDGCFLWNMKHPHDVTIASLSSVLLYRPKLDYLFIGCDDGYGSIPQLNAIQNSMRLHGIVVEQMQVYNAIGTFNILNAEDRLVGLALLMSSSHHADDDSDT
jgi:uncharacterized protein